MTHMTKEEFRPIYEEWKQSGLSIRQYCRDTGIKVTSFCYWRSRFETESLPPAYGNFIPIKMSGKTSAGPAGVEPGKALCEVVYPNGVVVRVTSDISLDQLRQMVNLLC
jgi:hypothetical protein